MSEQRPQSVTESGRTVDDAVQRALRRMGMSRGDVDVEVVEEGRHGIFGIGQSQATVRVTAKSGAGRGRGASGGGRSATAPPLPKIDDYADPQELEPGQRRGRGGSGGGERERGRGGDRRPQRRLDPARYGNQSENADGGDSDRDSGGDAPAAPEAVEPDHRARGRSGGRSGGRSRDGDRRSRPIRGRDRDRDRDGDRDRDRERPPARPPLPPFELLADPEFEPGDDPRQFAVELLTDLSRLLGFDVNVTARDPETPMDGLDHAIAVLDVDPNGDEDLGLLIGRHGSHVAALQYVVNVILSRALEGNHPITVDVDGYRRRREQALVEMAERARGEVEEYGEPVELGSMPPAERRIIHLQFQDDEELTTKSVGSGQSRRVRILYRETE